MHVDAEHFGVHEERASLDWLDEGVLAKILSACSRDSVCRWNTPFVILSSIEAQIGEVSDGCAVMLSEATILGDIGSVHARHCNSACKCHIRSGVAQWWRCVRGDCCHEIPCARCRIVSWRPKTKQDVL